MECITLCYHNVGALNVRDTFISCLEKNGNHVFVTEDRIYYSLKVSYVWRFLRCLVYCESEKKNFFFAWGVGERMLHLFSIQDKNQFNIYHRM